jgi:ribosomal protein S18 acetylase RimI-like enzyme
MDAGKTDRPDGARRVELRLAAPDDVEALQSVFERVGDHFLRVTGRAAPAPDAAQRELSSASSSAGREVALIEPVEAASRGTEPVENGQPATRKRGGDPATPVGAIGWWAGHPEPDMALLGMLMIVQDERGRGLGAEALRLLEARLREAGIARLRTAVGAEDREASGFLEAVGFSSIDERTHVDVDSGRLRIAFFDKPL